MKNKQLGQMFYYQNKIYLGKIRMKLNVQYIKLKHVQRVQQRIYKTKHNTTRNNREIISFIFTNLQNQKKNKTTKQQKQN